MGTILALIVFLNLTTLFFIWIVADILYKEINLVLDKVNQSLIILDEEENTNETL